MQKRTVHHIEDKQVKTAKLDFACARYSMGRAAMRKVAEDAGAVIRVGRSYLVNLPRVDAYMDAISQGQ